MLRYLLWRLLGLLAVLLGAAALAWLLGGGPGRVLRGARRTDESFSLRSLPGLVARALGGFARALPTGLIIGATALGLGSLLLCLVLVALRAHARSRRSYVRLRVEAYRADSADAAQLARMFTALHGRVLERWWRRLLGGQPSLALEVHSGSGCGDAGGSWLALVCLRGQERIAEAALQIAYPNTRLLSSTEPARAVPAVLRLKKRHSFLERVATAERTERAPVPPMNRLLTALAASGADGCGEPVFVQFALTPAPLLFERLAHRAFRHREDEISRRRRDGLVLKDRSTLLDSELRGGLEVQHRALFFTDIRIVGPSRDACEEAAAVLRVQRGENQLVERGTAVRHGLLGLYRERVRRGEGNVLAGVSRSVFSPDELALLWQLPATDYTAVPFARAGLPLAPAAPGIMRPGGGAGLLRDALGPVTIHPELRRQNTAVPGTVEQGKSSYLLATVAEDLRRENCAVILLDPKGDAADAAISAVPLDRTCTLLDFAHPTCGFNPLDVDAPADVIADYVVSALKNLFTDDGVILQL